MTRPIRLLAALCLALCLASLARAGDDRWYVVSLNGDKIGWMHERTRTDDDGHLVFSSTMTMHIARGAIDLELEVRSSFTETPEGEPVRMRGYQRMGSGPLETRYVFDTDGVRVSTLQRGRTTTRNAPLPADGWLTPGEVEEFVRKRIGAGAQTIEFSSIDAATGLTPVSQRWTFVGETNVEVFGKTVRAQEWSVTESAANTTSAVYLDDRGRELRMDVDLGGLKIEMLAADEALARAPFDAPEMMVDSLIVVDEDVPNARISRKASFVLRATRDDPVDLYGLGVFHNGGVQRVERIEGEPGAVRVVVDMDNNRPVRVNDALRAEALGAGAYIDPEDPGVAALAQRAAGSSADFDGLTTKQKADHLERFVRGYVEHKSLGVGFATSAEVCRTREGDCSEHAMLLAALLRAHDIPARVATGLVYADGFMGERRIFGYHMWTQALVDEGDAEVWHDVDAAIGGMDATHITIDASTFADDDPVQGMLDVVTVFGNLAIEVESVE
ncbi:MAG: transglutaminase domain-containing protein [Planctomycetota bacterium]